MLAAFASAMLAAMVVVLIVQDRIREVHNTILSSKTKEK